MQIYKSVEELSSLTDNRVIGAENLTMQNSDIRFNGTGNILVVEKGIKLVGSNIKFFASNSVIYLSSNSHNYMLDITVHNNSAVFIGKNNYFNGALHATVSEQKNLFIGDEGLFAFGIWIRTADAHLVYSTQTKQRVNPSKSVFIGDHVWVGQDAFVLKGSRVASGSIIGAASVCVGKHINSNESWAGNPARKICADVFWDETCVHNFTDREVSEHETFNSDKYIYSYSKEEYVSFDEIDKMLSSLKTAGEKLEYIKKLNSSKTKNRFVKITEV